MVTVSRIWLRSRSVASSPSPPRPASSTTIRLGAVSRRERISGSTKRNPMSSGPMNVPMRNARVRTRVRNSRRTTARTLCTGHLPHFHRRRNRRFRTHPRNEDRLQRRLHHRELRKAHVGGDERAKEPVSIGAGSHLHLRRGAVVLEGGHQAAVLQHPPRRL